MWFLKNSIKKIPTKWLFTVKGKRHIFKYNIYLRNSEEGKACILYLVSTLNQFNEIVSNCNYYAIPLWKFLKNPFFWHNFFKTVALRVAERDRFKEVR